MSVRHENGFFSFKLTLYYKIWDFILQFWIFGYFSYNFERREWKRNVYVRVLCIRFLGTALVFSLSILFCIWCHISTIFQIFDIVYLITVIIFYCFPNSLFLTSFMPYVTSNFCVRMNCAFSNFSILKSMTPISICVSNILCTGMCITMLLTSILVKKRVTYLILYGSPAFSQSFLTLIHGREFCKKPFRFFFFVFSFLFLVCVGVQRNFRLYVRGGV